MNKIKNIQFIMNLNSLLLSIFSAMFSSFGARYSRGILFLFLSVSLQATLPGDVIRNQAEVFYTIKNSNKVVGSNEVETTIGIIPARLEFLEYSVLNTDENITVQPTSYLFKSNKQEKIVGSFTNMDRPRLSNGDVLDITDPVPVRSTESYSSSDLVIVRVIDVLSNLDAKKVESIEIEINNGDDIEILKIKETANNTGVFVGYIQLVNQKKLRGDGVLFVQANDKIEAEYKSNGMVTEATLDIAKIAPDAKVYLLEGERLLPNIEVFLLDAVTGEVRYRTITDEHGLYHFGNIEAGNYTLYSEYVIAPEIKNGVAVGAAYVDVGYEAFEREIHQSEDGVLEVLDIPFSRKKVSVWVEKQASKERVGLGEFIQYSLIIHNNDVNLVSFLTLEDKLPKGLKYQVNSFELNGKKVEVSLSKDGNTLKYPIKRLIGKSRITLRYVAEVTAGVKGKEIVNQAWLRSLENKVVSNIASSVVTFQKELLSDKGVIVGEIRDLNNSGAMQGIRLYMEDGSYVISDREGKFHFENINMGMHVVQLDKDSLLKGYNVVSCQEKEASKGSIFSKFIEFNQGGVRRVKFCIENSSGITDQKLKQIVSSVEEKMPNYRAKDIDAVKEDHALLWPREGYMPAIPSTELAIVHPKNQRAVVWLNGSKVSLYNYDTTINGRKHHRMMTLYRGVDLLEGDNLFEVKFFDKGGKYLSAVKREIHISGTPVRIKYHEEKSRLIADGKTVPLIAVQFFDAQGYPLRRGIQGGYQLDAPYRSYTSREILEKTPLSMNVASKRFVIEEDGIAYIKLQPTSKAGEARLHFVMDNKEEKVVKAWLKPKPRDWILVGFAQGTVGYETLNSKSESTQADDKIYQEGRVAFFAKGKIKGSWILSMAYDSGKVIDEDKLNQEIDPQKYYTLYGDASEQSFDASSQKKLYLKIEKENFYTLFGDFETGFTTLELAQYSRRMQGVKSEYHGKYLAGSLFVSKSQQMFKRDEIRGDGTSGFYYLSQKGLIINSESITIEVRDRYHSERIIKREQLRRYRDYEIDYGLGRLHFKKPIHSKDEKLNPQYIIVNYELKSSEVQSYTYGARAVVNAADNIVLGSSFVHEDAGLINKELVGLDARIELSDQTLLKLEYAKSQQLDDNISSRGSAKLVQVEHMMGGFGINGYYREQEGSFGLGQVSSTLGGTRKLGVDFNRRFSRWLMESSFYRDERLTTQYFNDVAEFNLRFDDEYWDMGLGYRYVADSEEKKSNQILMMLSRSFLDHRLHLTLSRDQSLGANEVINFEDKTALQVNYNISSSMEVFSTYEMSEGEEKSTQVRAGVRIQPWKGATIENSQQSELSAEGSRVYNLFGFEQELQLSKAIRFSAGYEKSSKVENSLADDTAFDAYSLGLSYNGKRVAGNMRAELKESEMEDRKMLQSSIYTQRGDELALALGGRYLNNNTVEEQARQANIKTAIAYRVVDSKWTILSQLAYLNTLKKGSEEYIKMAKLVSNTFVNYQAGSETELLFSYGLKHVLDTFGEKSYSGYVDFMGLSLDHGFSQGFDLGFHAGLLHSYSGQNMEYSSGLYLGYEVLANTELRLGYNLLGFRDEDFSVQNYHRQGVYLQFNMKFDQESLKENVGGLVSW